MSKIGDFFKNFFSGANGLSSVWNGMTDNGNTNIENIVAGVSGSRLTGAQREANEFSHDEAALQRKWASSQAERDRSFQAKQAQLSRDWNEEMYEKYNSLSGKIAQAEQAGVNPLFAVTGNVVTPMNSSSSSPSGASVSGASASSAVSPTGHSLTDLLGILMGFMKVKSEINLMDSEAQRNRVDTEGQTITNESLRDMNAAEIMSKLSQVELNNANISLISAKVLNTEADTKVKEAQISQIASQIANTNADTKVKEQQIAVLLSEISKNNQSVELMKAQSSELGQRYENLLQEFGHREVINAINEVAYSRDSGIGEHSNGYYRAISEVKRFIDGFLAWFSGGASISKTFVGKK